ncbi:MAG: CDGSH iron-sulfur domain-containing protein [Tatlockia sp.]|nr:CDGSH iron-sulfur domain-containing protein [Tatlockia sp.]
MKDQETLPPFFPIAIEVEEGKVYAWCGCGDSKTQPLCDRSDCKKAVLYQAQQRETLYFCACKETRDPPFCDGSHARLIREYLQKKSGDSNF